MREAANSKSGVVAGPERATGDWPGLASSWVPAQARAGAIGAIPLFHGLVPEELTIIGSSARLQTVSANMEIIHRGDQNENLYCLLSGTVRISLDSQHHRPIVLGVLGAGEILGDLSTLDGQPASASVSTLELCRFLVLTRDEINRFVQGVPQIARNIITLQGRRMRRLTVQAEALVTMETEGRLARQLLLFAKDYGRPASSVEMPDNYRTGRAKDSVLLPLRLTQKDLAAICGCSSKQISRTLAAWQQRRLIILERGHRIVIPSVSALSAICPCDIDALL